MGKTTENTKGRWEILLKGLGDIPPGKKFKVRLITKQIIEDIQTRNERYVPWVPNSKRMTKNAN